MLYCDRIFSKKFSDETSKGAYLKACKWLAKNIYGDVEFAKLVSVQILKDTESEFPTFKVDLYVSENEKTFKENFCRKCKKLHTIFYYNDKIDCNSCKLNAYHLDLEKNIKCRKQFVKQILEEKLSENKNEKDT